MKWMVITQVVLLYVICATCNKVTKSPDGNKKQSVFCMPVTKYEKRLEQVADDVKLVISDICSYQPDEVNVCCANSVAYRDAINKFKETTIEKHRYTRAAEKASLLPKKAYCGKQLTERIFGGEITEIDEFPWLALFEYQNKIINGRGYACGGSIINSRYILTAAHCITGPGYDRLGGLEAIWLGEYNVDEDPDCIYRYGAVMNGEEMNGDCNDGAVKFTHEKIIPHPDYSSSDTSAHNDIALVRVNELIPYTDFIRPICLPTSEFAIHVAVGQNYTIAGWGKTESQRNSPVKLKVNVPIADYEFCAHTYKSKGVTLNNTSQICAGGVNKKDSCTGDSGGPLMDASGGSWYTIGVVSLGSHPCATENFPAVYTSVIYHLNWIENTLEE